MKKKFAGFLAIILLVSFVFAACTEAPPFIGRWGSTGDTGGRSFQYEFRRDGEGFWRSPYFDGSRNPELDEIPIKWATDENTIEILRQDADEPFIYFYQFEDGTLMLRRDSWPNCITMLRLD